MHYQREEGTNDVDLYFFKLVLGEYVEGIRHRLDRDLANNFISYDQAQMDSQNEDLVQKCMYVDPLREAEIEGMIDIGVDADVRAFRCFQDSCSLSINFQIVECERVNLRAHFYERLQAKNLDFDEVTLVGVYIAAYDEGSKTLIGGNIFETEFFPKDF